MRRGNRLFYMYAEHAASDPKSVPKSQITEFQRAVRAGNGILQYVWAKDADHARKMLSKGQGDRFSGLLLAGIKLSCQGYNKTDKICLRYATTPGAKCISSPPPSPLPRKRKPEPPEKAISWCSDWEVIQENRQDREGEEYIHERQYCLEYTPNCLNPGIILKKEKGQLIDLEEKPKAAIPPTYQIKSFQEGFTRPNFENLEPWQMTAYEWGRAVEKTKPETVQTRVTKSSGAEMSRKHNERVRLNYGVPQEYDPDSEWYKPIAHKDIVLKAIDEGKVIHPLVIEDYPELKKEIPEAETPGTIPAYLTDKPFTKDQIDDSNRFSHYTVDPNVEFMKAIKGLSEKTLEELKGYGYTEMPINAQAALGDYRKALYHYNLTHWRNISYHPGSAIVGASKYPTKRRDAYNTRETANFDRLQKAKESFEKVIKDLRVHADPMFLLLKKIGTAINYLPDAVKMDRLNFGKLMEKKYTERYPNKSLDAAFVREKGRELHEQLIYIAIHRSEKIEYNALKDYPKHLSSARSKNLLENEPEAKSIKKIESELNPYMIKAYNKFVDEQKDVIKIATYSKYIGLDPQGDFDKTIENVTGNMYDMFKKAGYSEPSAKSFTEFEKFKKAYSDYLNKAMDIAIKYSYDLGILKHSLIEAKRKMDLNQQKFTNSIDALLKGKLESQGIQVLTSLGDLGDREVRNIYGTIKDGIVQAVVLAAKKRKKQYIPFRYASQKYTMKIPISEYIPMYDNYYEISPNADVKKCIKMVDGWRTETVPLDFYTAQKIRERIERIELPEPEERGIQPALFGDYGGLYSNCAVWQEVETPDKDYIFRCLLHARACLPEGAACLPGAGTRKCIKLKNVPAISKIFHKKTIKRCKKYAPTCNEGKSCLPEKMSKPAREYPRRSEIITYAKSLAEQETYMQETAGKTLAREILSRGGIAPYKRGREKEEYKGIPLVLKNKQGLPLDEMASEMMMDEAGLMRAIHQEYKVGEKKKRAFNWKEYYNIARDALMDIKAREFEYKV